MSEQKILPEMARVFAVFVDTNAIHTHEKDIALFSEGFTSWWKDVSSAGDVKLIIPALVYKELHQQKTKFYWDQYKNSVHTFKNLEEQFSLEGKFSYALNYDDLKKLVDQKLFSQLRETPNCSLADIPYNKISGDALRNIVERAIWRIPPFKNNKEGEGFRDAIILEVLRVYRESNPHVDVIFLSNDYALQEAAREISLSERNLISFKERDSASAYIDAARTKFSPEFLSDVIAAADKILKSLNSVEIGETIINGIVSKFSLKKGDLGFVGGGLFSPSFICEGQPSFHTLDTAFLSVVGENSFHWETVIGVFCNYSRATVSTILGLAEQESNDNIRVRMLLVKVEWEAKISENKIFTDFKLIGINGWSDSYKLLSEVYSDASESEAILDEASV